MKTLVITQRITSIKETSFKRYLADVAKIKSFTPEEELACSIKAHNHDPDAMNELVRRNLRFVISVAKQYVNNGNTIEDLVNEGNIGLVLAAKRFEPNKGLKFITYAVWWIRKHILDYVYSDAKMIRFPANKLNDLAKLDKQIIALEQKLGRSIDLFELIDYESEFSFDIPTLEGMLNLTVDSLDRQINYEYDESLTYLDMVPDANTENSDYLVVKDKLTDKVIDGLNNLPVNQRKMMVMLFGLDGNPEKTLKEVGEEFNMSRENVRILKNKLLLQLRNKVII